MDQNSLFVLGLICSRYGIHQGYKARIYKHIITSPNSWDIVRLYTFAGLMLDHNFISHMIDKSYLANTCIYVKEMFVAKSLTELFSDISSAMLMFEF